MKMGGHIPEKKEGEKTYKNVTQRINCLCHRTKEKKEMRALAPLRFLKNKETEGSVSSPPKEAHTKHPVRREI